MLRRAQGFLNIYWINEKNRYQYPDKTPALDGYFTLAEKFFYDF